MQGFSRFGVTPKLTVLLGERRSSSAGQGDGIPTAGRGKSVASALGEVVYGSFDFCEHISAQLSFKCRNANSHVAGGAELVVNTKMV